MADISILYAVQGDSSQNYHLDTTLSMPKPCTTHWHTIYIKTTASCITLQPPPSMPFIVVTITHITTIRRCRCRHCRSARQLRLFPASPANYFAIIAVSHISLSWLGSSRLISFGLIWPRLISFGLSSHLGSSCLVSFGLILSRLVSSRPIWSRLVSPGLVSSHLVSPHLTWFYFVSSRFVSPRFASSLSFFVSSCFVLCYLFRHLSRHDWSCLLGLPLVASHVVAGFTYYLVSPQYLASCLLSNTCYLSL
jgi:hypothetical protein